MAVSSRHTLSTADYKIDYMASHSQRTAVYSEKIDISTWRSTREKPASRSASRMTGGGTQLSMVSQ